MNPSDSCPAEPPPPKDNFYSPLNFEFYSCQPYKPLERSSQTIRLLAVTKDESGQFQCTLKDSVPLVEADGVYTAISYCAGDPNKTRSILVNGLHFNAFANLSHAIEEVYKYRAQKYGDVEALLWIDQICIDQSNPTERSHQVGLMYKIYSSAREVTVCLSTDDHRGGSALAWLTELCRAFPQIIIGACAAEHTAEAYPLENRKSHEEELIDFTCHLETDLRDAATWSAWYDFLDMLQQPWWSRAWVVQEYVAARNAVFLYGGNYVPKPTMTGPLRWIFEKRKEILKFIEDYRFGMGFRSDPRYLELYELSNRWHTIWLSYRRSILDLVLGSHTGSQSDLLQLFSHSRNCSASDKRDHIYAFLGLDDNSYNINIDYAMTNSTEALFLHSAQQIIARTKNLCVLNFVDNSTAIHGLPSWVPDWSSRDSGNRNLIWSDPAAQTSAPWPFPPVVDIHFLENGRVLEVSGVFLDTFDGPNPNHWTTTKNNKFDICTAIKNGADKDDQLWVLHGTRALAVLRPHSGHFKFRTEAHFDKWGQPYWPKKELGVLMKNQKSQRIRLV
ncbi:heterokaryon incompatibility protein-domain-containing protein [Phaeosphaeria sp. MPI-PUGE-AT-0046c]|nr:heterokaryon incompatibility protein-domain-containing protein [Phaeosphaeria sp. MPI-PUGE-AT-0046c]